MEVGAVKHQLNTEIIKLKKKLNQAKVHIISKLTRKAKTLKSQKKCPDHLKEKVQRKAVAAVEEVLLLKKVQPKGVVRFAITHEGKLEDFINKPTVNEEKVYAKILIHKTMQEQYQHLRQLYSNMPIDQLLMTRKERLELKKKNQDSKKSKQTKLKKDELDTDRMSDNEEDIVMQSNESDDEIEFKQNECYELEHSEHSNKDEGHIDSESDDDTDTKGTSVDSVKSKVPIPIESSKETIKIKTETPKLSKPNKSKTKKLIKTKIKPRKKETEGTAQEEHPLQVQVVDSFFLTESGDQYLTLTEPRAPDEVKEDHYRGNRRMRRAEQFGKPIRPKKQSFRKEINHRKFERPSNERKEFDISNRVSKSNELLKASGPSSENLHPSWEAKKQKSGIVAFQGKKVVFS